MLDDNSNQKTPEKKPAGGDNSGGFKFPAFPVLAWTLIIGATILMAYYNTKDGTKENVIQQSEFLQKFESNQVATATIVLNQQTMPLTEIRGIFFDVDSKGKVLTTTNSMNLFVLRNAWLTSEMVNTLTHSSNIKISSPNIVLQNVLISLVPF